MKTKITKKELRRFNLYSCGYGELQDICAGVDADYYNAGACGWNFDVYTYTYNAITTGYRGMVGKKIPRALIEKYSEKARRIGQDRRYKSWSGRQRALKQNYFDFFREVVGAEEARG